MLKLTLEKLLAKKENDLLISYSQKSIVPNTSCVFVNCLSSTVFLRKQYMRVCAYIYKSFSFSSRLFSWRHISWWMSYFFCGWKWVCNFSHGKYMKITDDVFEFLLEYSKQMHYFTSCTESFDHQWRTCHRLR